MPPSAWALLQRVAAAIGLLGLVAYHMGQRRLHDLARGAGDVAGPVPEAGSETVDGGVFDFHPT